MSLPDSPNHVPDKPNWTWIPIRSLGPRHRERITSHLLSLPESDRYLRFGYAATDGQLSKYVDMLDFEQDEVFGIFNRRLELIAMAHLAHAISGLAGATVERAGSESEAWLRLPPDTLASHVGELVEHQAAELDYRLKVHAHQVSTLLDVISEVKSSVGNSSRVAQD